MQEISCVFFPLGNTGRKFMEMHMSDLKQNGLKVVVKNGDLERAIRRLDRLVKDEGVMAALKKGRQFDKPSVLKRQAKDAAIKRWHRKQKELG